MKLSMLTTLLLFALLAGIAGGCGGGGGGTPPITSAPGGPSPRASAKPSGSPSSTPTPIVTPTPILTPTPLPTPTPVPTTMLVPMGVDYGLKRQCMREPSPGQANFYSDNVDCPGSAYPTSNFWLTVAEIENPPTFGVGCIGPSNQSVPVNAAGSPVSVNWTGNSASGYTVEFKVDYTSIANPCYAPTWTAVGLIDNRGLGGGPIPRPDQFRVQFTTMLKRTTANFGGSHLNAETSGDFNVAGSNTPIHFSVSIELFWDQTFLCCGIPPGLPPDVIAYASPGSNSPSEPNTYFIDYDGSKLNPPLVLAQGTSTQFTIDWGPILQHAINEGLLPAPVNGWSNSNVVGDDSVLGLELKNTTTGPGGGMADALISNYRETAVIKP